MSIYMETERLVVREFTQEDATDLHRISNEPYILKWMPDWESTMDQMHRWIDWVTGRYGEATKETARVMLAVTLKSSGQLIGMVGIGNKEEVDNEIEIAYFISEEYASKGYTTEAAKAMIDWTFENLGLDYLIAIVELDNYPSQKIVQRCNFEHIDNRMILNSGESEEKEFQYYRLYNN